MNMVGHCCPSCLTSSILARLFSTIQVKALFLAWCPVGSTWQPSSFLPKPVLRVSSFPCWCSTGMTKADRLWWCLLGPPCFPSQPFQFHIQITVLGTRVQPPTRVSCISPLCGSANSKWENGPPDSPTDLFAPCSSHHHGRPHLIYVTCPWEVSA